MIQRRKEERGLQLASRPAANPPACKTSSGHRYHHQVRCALSIARIVIQFQAFFPFYNSMKGSEEMTVVELAKRYRVKPTNVYRAIYNIEAVEGITFNRTGRKVDLTPDNVARLVEELERLGYKRGS